MRPYYEEGGITLYHGDCRDVLPELRADFVVTDPPYNCGKNYGPGTDDRKEWPDWAAWLDEVLDHCKASAPHVFSFLSQVAYRKYLRHGKHEVDWTLVWYKPFSSAVTAAPFMPHWEHVAYWGKQKKGGRGNSSGWGSDLLIANVEIGGHGINSTAKGHPTPKPLSVMNQLLVRIGEGTIIDPFAGSGTTLLSAKNLGRTAIGIELEERFCELMAKRLAQSVMNFGAAK